MNDMLRDLLAVDDQLSDLLIHAAPRGEAEVADMRALSSKRDQVQVAINRLIDLRFKAATQDLSVELGELSRINAELEKVDRTLTGIKQGFALADQVLTVAAKLVTKLATAV